MKNWKTTLGGALAALGTFFANSEEGVLSLLGQAFQVVGLFLVGYTAQDAVKKA